MELKKDFLLPCGASLANRIAKSAMSENMSPRHHGPTKELINAYRRWAQGKPGLLITGNIMIDRKAIAEPGNVLVEDRSDIELLSEWASVVNIKGMSALFKTPKALTEDQIHDLIARFGNTAGIMKDAGFTGIQIHAAHGYLISQFLSPLSNQRQDDWGGKLTNRARFLLEVYKKIRSKVGAQFPIGVKINSADFQRGGFTEEESMEVVKLLDDVGVDLIEVSGGNYEKPAMTGATVKESTVKREAYFLEYVKKVRKLVSTPLMLTGGFRTVAMMEQALSEDALDIIGLARPYTLNPDLAQQIFDGNLKQLNNVSPKTGIKLLDNSGFVDIKWHEIQIHRLGKGKKPKPNLNPYSVISHNIKTTFQKTIFGQTYKS